MGIEGLSVKEEEKEQLPPGREVFLYFFGLGFINIGARSPRSP